MFDEIDKKRFDKMNKNFSTKFTTNLRQNLQKKFGEKLNKIKNCKNLSIIVHNFVSIYKNIRIDNYGAYLLTQKTLLGKNKNKIFAKKSFDKIDKKFSTKLTKKNRQN